MLAQRTRLADAAAVKDQRVGGDGPFRGRHRRAQLLLDDLRIVPRRDPDPVRHAEHVAIDGQSWHAEGMAEHDVRGLAADAGQLTSASIVAGCPGCGSTTAVAMPTSDFDLARKNPVD